MPRSVSIKPTSEHLLVLSRMLRSVELATRLYSDERRERLARLIQSLMTEFQKEA